MLRCVRDILRCLIWRHKATDAFICIVIGWSSLVERSFVDLLGFYGLVIVSVERGFHEILPLFLLFVIRVILANLILDIVI